MRFPLAMMALIFAASTALAVDFRWTLGFAQGTLEAIIRNGNDSEFNVFCPTGWEGERKRPGMFIHVAGIHPAAKEQVTVQIIVDDKNYSFYLDEVEFRPYSRLDWMQFETLVDALASSKRKSFVVEFPKYNKAETFSLIDARKSLARNGKNSILGGCDRKAVETPSSQ